MARGRTFPMPGAGRCDRRGSAPLSPGSGDVAYRPWSLWLRDACLQPSYAQASSRRLRLWAGNLKAPGVSSSHRPHSHGTRRPPGSGGIGRGLPLNVVRIAPLHDAGITMRHGEICTLWAKLPSHACRGASRRSCPLPRFPKSANVNCVHGLCYFVKGQVSPFR